jgi:tripartite-type tricarboxylate transporter receptor subunit TctC
MKRSSWNGRLYRLALAAAFVSASCATGLAQNYPQQTIKIILPFAAGGGADVVGRSVAEQLSEIIGQPVVIENVAGAGGTLGTGRAAKSAADGYTLFIGTPSTHGTNVAVYPKLPYDAIKDFEPIGLITTSPLMLVTSQKFEADSVGDLIKMAREKPGEIAYGSFGVGSINHLASELFQSMAGIKTNHIPYRGSAPALTDLIGGRIQYTIDGPAALSFIRAGTVKLLAVGSLKRWSDFPNAPTMSEAGVPGYEATTWFGLFAPAGTPKPIVAFLNEKLDQIVKSPRSKEAFAKLGVDAAGGPPSVLSTTVDNEIKKWVKVANEKNIKIEP